MATEYFNFDDADVPTPREHTGGPRASRNLSGLFTVMDPRGGWVSSRDTVAARR